jgi:uncharacterized membrane protein
MCMSDVAAVLAELAERQYRVTGSHFGQRGIGAGAVAEHGQAAGDHIIGVQIAGYLDGILHVRIRGRPFANHRGRLAETRGHHVHDAFVEKRQVFF